MKDRLSQGDGRGRREDESHTEARTRHDARSHREQESQTQSPGDGGARIGVREYLMRAMARDASGCDAQSFFEKAFPMDALGIVF